jgi:5-enolpyruvylshikimate-3-phosphate synthase
MAARRVRPAPGPLDVALEATPSKSVTHRALLAAAIARGPSRIERPLESEDTLATREGLRALGIGIEAQGDAWLVEGCAGRLPGGAALHLGGVGGRASGS